MLFKKAVKYIPAFLFLSAVLLNAVAWSSTPFCDFYVIHIFPAAAETYGRFSALFPFSIGEWMLAAAFLMLVAAAGGGLACLAARRLFPWYRRYLKLCGTIASVACLVMTLNCFILYHCSPITDMYEIGGQGRSEYGPEVRGGGEYGPEVRGEGEYGREELALLRDYVVTQANELAEQLPRDEKGYIDETVGGDIIARTKTEMNRLGEAYPRLSGYYPEPKPFLSSHFFSQQYIMGYYFPFSMEANYNDTMYVVNKPTTICHELSHLKGFIYEDEANFIGFLACVGSEDPLFQYSAYLSVIGYLDYDFYEAVGRDADAYRSHPPISELVRRDDIFLTPEAWEEVEETALLDTELVKEVSGEIIETNLTLNGVADGAASYGRVVGLLLRYYDGVLW